MKNCYFFYLFLLSFVFISFGSQVSNANPLSLPYECLFTTEADLNGWTMFNRDNDELTWYMSTSDYGGNGVESKASANFEPTDNWLVSPQLQLEDGGRYQISFMAYTAYYYNEKMRITIGTSPEPEAQTKVVKEVLIPKYEGYYGYKVTAMLTDMPAGAYYIGLQYYTENAQTMCVCLNNFKVETMSEGSVSGKVTTSAGAAMAGLEVKLAGMVERTAKTDEQGQYSFSAVPQGDYKISTIAFGYNKAEQSVVVNPEQNSVCNITLQEMEKSSLTGIVKDKNGNGVSGARIRLVGYSNYTAVTDATGNYTIDGIYIDGYSAQYNATVYKNFYGEQSRTAYISGWGGNTCDFTLKGKAVAPYEVVVTSTDDAATSTIEWAFPVDMAELSFDNGTPKAGASLGFENSRADSNILGVVFREPMTVYGAKWFMTEESQATQVNVNVLEVDANGEPTGKVIYIQEDVPFVLGDWSSVVFPEPVNCPNGFILALSSEDYLSLAVDTNDEILDGKTQMYGNTMNAPQAYKYFEDNNWSGAMLVRAEGERYEPDAVAPTMTYNVYRFAEADKTDETAWTKIGSDLTDKTMTDSEFGTVKAGTYYYAVSATNALDAVESGKTISSAVQTRYYAKVVINVKANSVDADAVGAIITLNGGNGHTYNATVGSDNKAIFESVLKGNYSLSAKQQGFLLDEMNIDVSVNEEYTFNVELSQVLAPVANIDFETSPAGNATVLKWDLFADIFDDFEGEEYQDFELNPTGKFGWDYVDNDGKVTYGFAGSTFPGMGSPMAAILMNGNAVVPSVTTNIAYSGERELAFFACRANSTEGGMQKFDSDDYVISPALDYHKDFVLSFYARTYQSQDGIYERFRVGYSTTGKDLKDFTWLSDYVTAPEVYTYYEYSIPKEARYITINSSSQDGFIYLVDDIKLSTGILHSGEEPSRGQFNGYNIYVDSKLEASTKVSEYILDWRSLSAGTHTVGITKVYASGESAELSVKINVDNGGVEVVGAESVKMVMNSSNMLSIFGSHKGVTVYSVSGNAVANAAKMEASLDLSNLPKGVYIAKAQEFGGSVVTTKIIVR